MLIEELEIPLHAGGLKILLDMFLELTRSGRRIVMTTHSMDLLLDTHKRIKNNNIGGDTVPTYLATKEKGKAKCRLMNFKEYLLRFNQ